MRPSYIGKEQAWQKIVHFCNYQERSHKEVKNKLYTFGLYPSEVEELTARLIEQDLLNEMRYALAFAGGKFRMNDWGKTKIRYEMKLKGLSDYSIRKALLVIDDEAYEEKCLKLLEQKWRTLKSERNLFSKMQKATSYLMQKGYESDLIKSLIKKITTAE